MLSLSTPSSTSLHLPSGWWFWNVMVNLGICLRGSWVLNFVFITLYHFFLKRALIKPASGRGFLLKIGKLKGTSIHILNLMEFISSRVGFEKSQEFCSGPTLGCKSRIKALKTVFVESWLSWTDGKEACQWAGPLRGRKRLHRDPCSEFQEQDLNSFHLGGCAHSPWSLAPLQWSAWRRGSPWHHSRARAQSHQKCQTEIRELA